MFLKGLRPGGQTQFGQLTLNTTICIIGEFMITLNKTSKAASNTFHTRSDACQGRRLTESHLSEKIHSEPGSAPLGKDEK